jgi:multidrug efflux pump subunit AcrB
VAAVVQLQPKSRRKASADQVIAELRPRLAQVPGIQLFLQSVQDVRVGGRASRTQYQYTLQDANLDELNEWAPRLLQALKALPELRDAASDQQTISPSALSHAAATSRWRAVNRASPSQR